MPCYSYICYRILREYPAETGYFHSSWPQESFLLGQTDYIAREARGKGKFVDWNLTVRGLAHDSHPVDENEKFYIDGETVPSVEFQGLEDSFGFSGGFPETDNFLPLAGHFKFLNGTAAYRFLPKM